MGPGGVVALGRKARRWRPRRLARARRTAVLAEINFGALDPAWIGVEDFSLKRFRPGHELAANGHMAGFNDEIAAERVDFLGDVADIELAADRGAHVVEAGAAIG